MRQSERKREGRRDEEAVHKEISELKSLRAKKNAREEEKEKEKGILVFEILE